MDRKFNITYRTKFGYMIIDISGNLSVKEIDEIKKYIGGLNSKEFSSLILNMEGVSFITDSGLKSIVIMADELSKKGFYISAINVNEDIYSIFERRGLKNYFKFISDEQDLMNRLKEKELNNLLKDVK